MAEDSKVVAETPQEKGTAPEKKEPAMIADITQLYARPQREEDDELVYNDLRIPYKFRHISWPRYNQLIQKAFEETATIPDLYERVKQEYILKEMITEMAGVRLDDPDVKTATWAQFDSFFCEALRKVFFETTGEMRISGALLKNLLPTLDEQIKSLIDTKMKSRL